MPKPTQKRRLTPGQQDLLGRMVDSRGEVAHESLDREDKNRAAGLYDRKLVDMTTYANGLHFVITTKGRAALEAYA